MLTEPSAARDRLVDGIYSSEDKDDLTGRLHHAMQLTIQVEPIEKKLRAAGFIYAPDIAYAEWIETVVTAEKISREEGDLLLAAKEAVRKAIMVDDFPGDLWSK
jgi:acyl-CoA dehydrogenase